MVYGNILYAHAAVTTLKPLDVISVPSDSLLILYTSLLSKILTFLVMLKVNIRVTRSQSILALKGQPTGIFDNTQVCKIYLDLNMSSYIMIHPLGMMNISIHFYGCLVFKISGYGPKGWSWGKISADDVARLMVAGGHKVN